MLTYVWLSIPTGVLLAGLICLCEYKAQVWAAKLLTESVRPEDARITQYTDGGRLSPGIMLDTYHDNELVKEIAGFRRLEAIVSVVSVTVVVTALLFGLTRSYGLWAYIPLTLVLLGVACKRVPGRIRDIRAVKNELKRKAKACSENVPQLTSHVVVDSDGLPSLPQKRHVLSPIVYVSDLSKD